MTTTTDLTTQIYQVFIKASPEKIWEAITQPDQTARYFHGARITHDKLEGAPKTAASVSGPGWMFVLSGLKTVLETGESLAP